MKIPYARQGDVLINKIDSLPKGVKKLKTRTVAYGEVTGHSHKFLEGVDIYQLQETLFLQVHKPQPLIHEEHNKIMLDPGFYEISNEREYDYINEDLRKVID